MDKTLKNWMDANGVKANEVARIAGISPGRVRNARMGHEVCRLGVPTLLKIVVYSRGGVDFESNGWPGIIADPGLMASVRRGHSGVADVEKMYSK